MDAFDAPDDDDDDDDEEEEADDDEEEDGGSRMSGKGATKSATSCNVLKRCCTATVREAVTRSMASGSLVDLRKPTTAC